MYNSIYTVRRCDMDYAIVFVTGYLVCCINSAYLIARAKGFDIRTVGSKNPGTSNAFITLGPAWGVLVGAIDILKTAAVVYFAGRIFADTSYVMAVAATGCLVGNVFPATLRFRGGKGFATFMGVVLAYNWIVFLACVAIVAAATLITDHMVVGTFIVIGSFPIVVLFLTNECITFFAILACSILIFCRHSENIRRLKDGTEIGLRGCGKNRVSTHPEDEQSNRYL